MSRVLAMTNATKAQIIVALNAVMGVLIAFDVPLTLVQVGTIDVAVNAVFGLFVAATYTSSAKRVPSPDEDGPGK